MLSRSALILLLLASAVAANDKAEVERPVFKPTEITGHFVEQFTDDWEQRWAHSQATKQGEMTGDTADVVFRFDGEWAVEEPVELAAIEGDKGLVLKSPAKHHALVAKFDEPLDNTGKTLVLQYEVKMQNPVECGGAYLKLLTHQEDGLFEASKFDDKTPYTIMFGPDKCGSTNKVHFIFRHKNPKTGEFEEKHMRSPPMARITRGSVLYTLIVKPDNTYEVQINGDKVSSGDLLKDFDPPVNPEKEIPDPDDKKPADWVDEEKIEDSNATKPDDWDEDAPFQIPDPESKKPEDWLDNEPTTITDPDAEQPADWDVEEDGEWVAPSIPNPRCDEVAGCGEWKAPLVANPAYKGPWYPPMIENPAYKGRWRPRFIPNPDYFEDKHPSNFEKMDAIGFELWTMQGDILFDNIYVGHSIEDAKALADETWKVKNEVEEKLRKKDEPEPEPEAESTEDVYSSIMAQANAAIAQFRANFEEFYEHAQQDFVQAVVTFPLVVAGLVGAALVGLLLSFSIISAVSGATASPAPSTGKKSAAVASKGVADKAKASDSEASASDLGGNEGDNEAEGSKKSRRSRKKTRKVDN